MKKKLISVMLCAAMATTMFSSVAVHAEGDDEYVYLPAGVCRCHHNSY